MAWLFLVLISTISFSIATLLQRVLLKEEQSDPVAYGFVFELLVAFFIFIYALINGFVLPPLLPVLGNLFIMTLFYALFNLFLFKAYQETEAAEVSILTSSRVLWSVLTAVIFLGEDLNIKKGVGILILLIGVVVILWQKEQWKLNSGHLYALLGAVFFGIAFTNDIYLINYFKDVPSYMCLSFFFPSILLLMLRPQAVKKLKMFFKASRLLKMSLTSLLWGLSALTIFWAYQAGGEVIQIAPISQFSIVLVTFLAYIFLKERNNLTQKTIGGLLVFIGVMLLL